VQFDIFVIFSNRRKKRPPIITERLS